MFFLTYCVSLKNFTLFHCKKKRETVVYVLLMHYFSGICKLFVCDSSFFACFVFVLVACVDTFALVSGKKKQTAPKSNIWHKTFEKNRKKKTLNSWSRNINDKFFQICRVSFHVFALVFTQMQKRNLKDDFFEKKSQNEWCPTSRIRTKKKHETNMFFVCTKFLDFSKKRLNPSFSRFSVSFDS